MNWKHWLGVGVAALVAVAIANRVPGLSDIITPKKA